MKNTIILLICAIFCLSSTSVRAADPRDIAVALVKKAVAFNKAHGPEKLIEEASNPKGQFVDGSFYVFVMDMDAIMLAHPMNASLIGTPNMTIKDVNGKLFTKEMIDVAKANGSGWVDYLFKNPKTNEVAPKSSYVETTGDLLIGCGVYRN